MHACLTQKKAHVCGAGLAVWRWVFLRTDRQISFCNLPTLSTFFHFADLLGLGNGCCMKHVQGFEGLVSGWGLAH